MRALAILTLALIAPFAAHAQCSGKDLIVALSPGQLAPLRAAADAEQYAVGNFWRAVKGPEELILVGTLHLDDPRFDVLVPAVLPYLTSADLLLVEAGPTEIEQLKSHLARDPSLLVNTDGPTLPEILPEAEWQAMSAAMTARGVPGFMAAKFRPWYVSVLLSLPPCAMTGDMTNGLDQRLMSLAEAQGIAISGLEPYDTAFTIFQQVSPEQQLAMLSSALAAEVQSEDMTATLVNSYFAEDVRLNWEFTEFWVKSLPGIDPASAEAEFALFEKTLMNQRNEAWIPVIEAALVAQDGPVFAAFGALHLAGERGVLNLLSARGYQIERITLP